MRRRRLHVVLVAAAIAFYSAITALVGTRDDFGDAVPLLVALAVPLVLLAPRWPPAAALLQWCAVLLPLLAYIVTLVVVGDKSGSAEFHTVAAELIPILALGLAIDLRVFQLRRFEGPLPAFASLLPLGVLLFGEYQALQSVFTKAPADGDLVAAAIAAGFVGLITTSLLDRRADAGHPD
jgi:hypothetical protein